MLRWFFTIVLIVLALWAWAVTLLVPAFEATAPALIAIALSVAVYFAWPKRGRKDRVAAHGSN